MSHTEVGVDVEKIRPYPPRMPRRILAPSEQEQLLKSENREDLFFRFWTLKESYGKALGVGIGYPFREIHFQLGPVPTCNAVSYTHLDVYKRQEIRVLLLQPANLLGERRDRLVGSLKQGIIR